MKLNDYEIISGDEIDLKLIKKSLGDKVKGRSPEYKFQIQLHKSDQSIGHINLRLEDSEKIMQYIGHIGYGVDEEYRGHKYSYKACKLITRVMGDHKMESVIITCNPDNYSSRNTCELLGAELLEIVEVPKHLDIYSEAEAQKCRYRWTV
jgi:tagatose 1,6-diphosphate aldolase